jgi:LuxR family maltose regulon positive regulatory protein
LRKQGNRSAWISAFTGGHRYLLDYVQEEILQRQPLHIQDFLLKVTVLTRMNAPLCQAVTDESASSEDHFAMIQVRRWLALAYLRAGRLYLAYQECLASLALLEQIGGNAILEGYCSISLALVLYEWNRLEEARNALQRVIHDVAPWQHVDLLAWGYWTLVRVELAAGDLAAASQALQEAEDLGQQEKGVLHHSWVVGVRVQWWLAVESLAEASDWAARTDFRLDVWEPHRSEEFLALIRVYLAQQQYTQAVEALRRFSWHLDRPGDIAITVNFLSCSVVAVQQAGMNVQAHTAALRLLTLTEPEGYLRVYLEAGQPMKQALQNLLDTPLDGDPSISAVSHSTLTTLLTAFVQEERRRDLWADTLPTCPQEVVPPISQPRPVSASSSLVLVEPLTTQEQRVLRLLATGRSNQEIARTLGISLNTAKTHVKHLYGKLNVSSRMQASTLARDLRLL